MTWVYILPDDANPTVVTFDATMSETHDRTAQVTEHPVESGSVIADHVLVNPDVFSCEVFVSNTPITDLGRGAVGPVRLDDSGVVVQALQFPQPFDRVQEVENTLTGLIQRGAVLSVLSSIKTYDSMVLVGVGAPRTEFGGSSFNLQFKRISTVESLTVTAPKPIEPRGAPSKNKGGQGGKDPNKNDGAKASFVVKNLKGLGVLK